jgi:vacuolar-type H+-ATPase subunit H
MVGGAISLDAGGQSDVNVNIPFDQIYGLLDALQEAGNNVAGQAGIEVRASIDKLSNEIGARLDQLKSIGTDLWKMMYGDISKEIADIMKFLKDYTAQINQMVKDRITQIDTALAKRLDQISDMITDTISQVDTLIQHTIKTAEESAINVINQGEKSIITVLDNAFVSIVRTVLIIILVVLLVIVLVLAWKNVLPKTVPAIVVASVIGGVLIAGSLVFIFSNTVMGYVFGRKIELVQPQVAQAKGDDAYNGVIADAKGGASVGDLKGPAIKAIGELLTAKYVTKDPKVLKAIDAKIASVNALINPPPEPGSTVKLGTFSKFYTANVTNVKMNATLLKVSPKALYLTVDRLKVDPKVFKLNVIR